MIFTDDASKRFEDFKDSDFDRTDDTLGIKFEKQEIFDDTVLLLRYNCPDPECETACHGWPGLHRHVWTEHRKKMCDLCTRNKKSFIHEHELFSHQELLRHEKFGDDKPGAIDQSGFKGHPECTFCSKRFYGDDELFAHLRDTHEKCHVCAQMNPAKAPQYYENYDELEKHFAKDHFLCLDKECLEKKFVVFSSEMDLKGHQLGIHPNGLSKDARRDARRVDMSNFDYRTAYQEPRGGRRAGRGRGRDPNAEPLPASSAQPMRRDELAYQRQMALSNAQPPAPRTFGNPRPLVDSPSTRPTLPPPLPQLDQLTLNDSTPLADPTPQEEARRIQHNAVTERASILLKHDASKLTEFRNRISSYRGSHISATELIDSFFALFDCSSTELGKLIKELADIYENLAKRDNLLKAWNDWRAINEDYPTLPGPAGDLPSTANTSSSSRRILKLKSSTAQSSRSKANTQVAWAGAVAPSATPASNPFSFPALAAANRAGPGRVGPVPWTNSSTPVVRSSAPARRPSNTSARAPLTGPEAFPALPAAAKPNTRQFGLHNGKINWDDRGPAPVNPWGRGDPSSSVTGPDPGGIADEEGGDAVTGKSGKKNKKGKQTLLKYG